MTLRRKWLALVPIVTSAITGVTAAFPDCTNGPLANNTVCDTSADFVDRAKALVAEFTLADMIANTGYQTPGVSRLGLPAYTWWSEALHGVAGSPGVSFTAKGTNFSFATSFPAPILLSAAFDDPLINSVAAVISTEARAFNNFGHAGLSFFTPNINPFKDPRWGRGQETPGEDPFHIGRYTVSLVTGLQGGLGSELNGANGQYLKIIADCKHYAAYDLENWEGNSRMAFNAIVSTQDLAEFYSPSFQACVRDAEVASIMCSYNSVNGIPSCASVYLMQNITRDHFGLGENQWITSDCDAVENIFDPHNFTSSLANASALALHAGTDIDCGSTYTDNLQAALNQSLIQESDIVQALVRRYGSLVRLGYFDSPDVQPYRQLDFSDVNTPSAQQLAYTAAIEGITLLKNDGILPLKSKSTVALIGPWANATTQMQSNYNGVAPFLISPLAAFQNAGFSVTFAAGTTITGTSTSGFSAALAAARAAELVVFAGGIDDSVEAEGMDRTSITWPGNQLQLIGELAAIGKPFIVLQMGGGQVDSSAIKANASVNALVWGGYPGQSGGTAIVDILTGKQAPAGRLPITQYPANYVNEVPMTDMTLRPSSTNPGRTYKWFTGESVFPFGFGLHYTSFSLSWSRAPKKSYNIQSLVAAAGSSGAAHTDLALLDSAFELTVRNTGSVTSDYVALLFSNTTAGPTPAPIKQLVGYTRVKSIAAGHSATAQLSVTLGSIARVDENGNSVLYPGSYTVWVDADVNGRGVATTTTSFQLTGKQQTISDWPQP
ncbi:glycoside hydrolase family 3 protein [Collybiopsis luxurians FD-317 M1]|nr:glycoside hydrolase family 3 protein [Collybiopsis luxurians FD-317 M1]